MFPSVTAQEAALREGMIRGSPARNPVSCTQFGDSMSSGTQMGSCHIPSAVKSISEQMEKLLPSLYFQKATKLQEARNQIPSPDPTTA